MRDRSGFARDRQGLGIGEVGRIHGALLYCTCIYMQ